MKRTSIIAFALATVASAPAQNLPAPSPLCTVEQVVGLTKVTVEYSRPSARDRAVFGELVPFNTLWRTGANACTKISFDGPVDFNGQVVAAGKYAVLSTPAKDGWVIYLNSDTTLGGTDGYDAAKNVATLKAEAQDAGGFTETFTIGFDAVKDDHAVLQFRWEKTLVSVPMHADALEQGKRNIAEAMKAKDVKAGTYHRCARFYLDRNIDAKQALEWAKKSDSMEQRYWVKHTLALCYAANGMKAEAITTAKESMELASKDGDAQYVKLNEQKIAEWSK